MVILVSLFSRCRYETKRAVVMTSEEKRKHRLLQQLRTLGHEKEHARKQANLKQRAEYLRKQAMQEAKFAPKKKEEQKALYRRLGKEEAKRQFAEQGGMGRPSKKRKSA